MKQSWASTIICGLLVVAAIMGIPLAVRFCLQNMEKGQEIIVIDQTDQKVYKLLEDYKRSQRFIEMKTTTFKHNKLETLLLSDTATIDGDLVNVEKFTLRKFAPDGTMIQKIIGDHGTYNLKTKIMTAKGNVIAKSFKDQTSSERSKTQRKSID